ncbi:MAG: ribonuclease P protein component [Maritimibacter sp.]|nr:ribonuclease P protein component [Maritimibacter sp.]
MPPGAAHEDRPPAASVCAGGALQVLTKRADFLACARARKAPAPAFLLQARRRGPEEAPGAISAAAIRVGFTASKKVGNAVARNRAKRRLRALARSVLAARGCAGWDYVLVARRDETVARGFAAMETDLAAALDRVHAPRKTA